jgi:ATP synthase protein I
MKPRVRKTTREITEYSAGTLELGMSVAIGIGIGYALDWYFETAPWWTLFWLVCGVAAGFRSLFRVAKRLEREAEEEEHHGDAS